MKRVRAKSAAAEAVVAEALVVAAAADAAAVEVAAAATAVAAAGVTAAVAIGIDRTPPLTRSAEQALSGPGMGRLPCARLRSCKSEPAGPPADYGSYITTGFGGLGIKLYSAAS